MDTGEVASLLNCLKDPRKRWLVNANMVLYAVKADGS